MNINEKLNFFTDRVFEDAEEKKREVLQEIEKTIQSACTEAKKKAKEESEEKIRLEKSVIEQNKNCETVSATTEAKKRLLALRNKLSNQLFENITAKLQSFVDSPNYQPYLLEKIKRVTQDYPDGVVLLMSRDMKFSEKIVEQTGCKILETAEDFIGGFKVQIHNGHGLIDLTFQSELQEQQKSLNLFKVL